MTEFLNLIIILVALVVFFIFKKTKDYLSWRGGALGLLVIILFVLKLISGADFASLGLRLDNYLDTLLPIIIFTLLGALILIAMRFRARKFKVGKWLLSLMSSYLVFGILQQLFFQSIFTSSLNELFDNQTLVVIFSSVYYSSFHWGWDAKGIKFGFLTLLSGMVWSILFLTSPNILLLGASHAVLASLYYFIVYEHNILEERLVFWRKKNFLQRMFG
ncbi:MAG: CPBP family glutamic-type intramembrane protease [Patescibacteria group bacterium]